MKSSQSTQLKREAPSYHHYSLKIPSQELRIELNDVRFILLTDCAHRAQAQIEYLLENLFNPEQKLLPAYNLEKLTNKKSRFSLSKLGPVLVSDCGLGRTSMSIALHELLSICKQAEIIQYVKLIRFGTCSGINVVPGTICITDKAFNSLLQDYVEQPICSVMVRRQCVVDPKIAKSLYDLALEHPNYELLGKYDVKLGATVGTDDYYEEQGRLNCAICDHNCEDRIKFLYKLSHSGVISMDLESHYISAMCHKLGVKFGIVCVALNDSLINENVQLTEDELTRFEQRLFWLNLVFVRNLLVQIVAVHQDVGPDERDYQADPFDSEDYDDGTCGGSLCVMPRPRGMPR